MRHRNWLWNHVDENFSARNWKAKQAYFLSCHIIMYSLISSLPLGCYYFDSSDYQKSNIGISLVYTCHCHFFLILHELMIGLHGGVSKCLFRIAPKVLHFFLEFLEFLFFVHRNKMCFKLYYGLFKAVDQSNKKSLFWWKVFPG